jgi:hypothetical protein
MKAMRRSIALPKRLRREYVYTFALDEGAAYEPAGATEQVVSSCALAFLEECGFHRHAPIRAQPRTTTREFAGRF